MLEFLSFLGDQEILIEQIPTIIKVENKDLTFKNPNKSDETIMSYGVMGGQYQPIGQAHVLQNMKLLMKMILLLSLPILPIKEIHINYYLVLLLLHHPVLFRS